VPRIEVQPCSEPLPKWLYRAKISPALGLVRFSD
jgi:hypothetical protein